MTIANEPIGAFLGRVASGETTPSAGPVAAVGGASGAALLEMVCIHTRETDGDPDVESAITEVETELASLRGELLALADDDIVAVDRLQDAVADAGAATGTERLDAIETAIEVPMNIAETSLAVLERAPLVLEAGSERAFADGVTGAFMADCAVRATLDIARVNVGLAEREAFLAGTGRRIRDIEESRMVAFDAVRDHHENT